MTKSMSTYKLFSKKKTDKNMGNEMEASTKLQRYRSYSTSNTQLHYIRDQQQVTSIRSPITFITQKNEVLKKI